MALRSAPQASARAGVAKDAWGRLILRFAPSMALLLWPSPGLAHGFAAAFARAFGALAPGPSGAALTRFEAAYYEPEHPWWVLMSVKNVFTTESFDVPVDTRTVAYIRIAVFVSLALAWPVSPTVRGVAALACGAAALGLSIGLCVAMPLLQVLGMVHVLPLGVAVQSILSVGILTLVSYPSMSFAVPALIWWVTVHIGEQRSPAAGG